MNEQYFISVPFFKRKLVYKARDMWNLSKFARKTGPYFTLCYPFFGMRKGITNMFSTILKRSWILLIVLKSPRIRFRSLKSNLSWFLYLVLKSPWNIQPCLRQTPFSKENLAHPWCKNLLSSQAALEHFCAWTTFHFCSFFFQMLFLYLTWNC